MSAIAGLIMLDDSTANIETIKSMLASMKHCGPDDQKFVLLENAAFGQALLATTPEALNEAQPWTDAATGCIVVTDSRLDNREFLAVSLELTGRPIDHIGDAELIFSAYQKWGDACAEKLLGDFTFAIWNPETRSLFCTRDQLGIRPFYYHYIKDKIFAFATTSEALRLLLIKPPMLDEGRIADALTDQLAGHDCSSTFFREIKRLPPAHSLGFQQNVLSSPRCYWQPFQNPPIPFPDNEKQWLDQLEALFVEAVHCRLRTHLPISAMLSGGLDSSSVIAVASEKLKSDGRSSLSTFSAVSGNPDCAETRAIRLMQTTFELSGTEIDSEKSPELIKAIGIQWKQLDECVDASNTLVHAQYHKAHEANARIMLDGIDADGLLTEGDYLHDLARAGRWLLVWRECRASVRFWGPEANLSYFLRPLVSEFLIPLPVRRIVRYLRNRFRPPHTHQQALIKAEFAQHVNLESRYQTLATNSAGIKATLPSGAKGYSAMASSYSANGVEHYHRLACQYGVEPRHPFMDRRLVEFCAWLPLNLRLRNGYPKWALRQAMSQRLPQQIAWRRGKEHLGWTFKKALWQQMGKSLAASALHPLLQRAVLDTVQTRYRQLNNLEDIGAVNEDHVEPLIKLAAVNFWLNKIS